MDWIQIKNTYNDPLRANLNNKNAFLQNLQKLAIEFIELSKQTFDNLTDEEHQALKTLSQDKTIVISKADKGNATFIQDLEVYRLKRKELLQQDGKFKRLNSDETIKRERKLQDYTLTAFCRNTLTASK